MLTGKLYPIGAVRADIWEKAYEVSLTAKATSVSITGLDGNTDVEWKLVTKVVNGTSNTALRIQPLGVSSDYGRQALYAQGAVMSATLITAGGSGMDLTQAASINELGMATMNIYIKSTYARPSFGMAADGVNLTSVSTLMLTGNTWNDTSSNATSVTVGSSVTGGLGSTTYITLWKKRAKA